MKSQSSGHMLINVSLALFAGALGSLLTLLVTSNLQIPVIHQSAEPVAVNSVNTVSSVGNNDSASEPEPAHDNVSHADFIAALEEASEERAQLANVLAQLTRQIESLESDVINQQAMDALNGTSQRTLDQAELAEIGHSGSFGDNVNFGQTPGGQDRIDTLISVGVDEQSAQALQSRQDQYQLARLELFDQAQREGWIDSEQFSERLTELNEQRPNLREELGDDAYDRYLLEAGQSNRVVIASIIPGSEADLAGLAPGDMVISYANERVFTTSDLQRATREGVRGEQVPVNVERQGQALFFDLQRGPLGVTLSRATSRQDSSIQ